MKRVWRGIAVGVLGAFAACGEATPDNAAFTAAYTSHTAAEVTVSASVTAVLPDSQGSDGTHQRFDIAIGGVTVEIDHNVTLAPRVPVAVGTAVTIHGQFEPDPGHPVIHYTHHATGRHEGGWITVGTQSYS